MGPWSLGKARWRDRVIWDVVVCGFGRREEGLETPQNDESRKEVAPDRRNVPRLKISIGNVSVGTVRL